MGISYGTLFQTIPTHLFCSLVNVIMLFFYNLVQLVEFYCNTLLSTHSFSTVLNCLVESIHVFTWSSCRLVPSVECYTLVLHRDASAVLFVAIAVDHDIFYRVDVWYFLPNSRLNLSEVVSLSDLNVGF